MELHHLIIRSYCPFQRPVKTTNKIKKHLPQKIRILEKPASLSQNQYSPQLFIMVAFTMEIFNHVDKHYYSTVNSYRFRYRSTYTRGGTGKIFLALNLIASESIFSSCHRLGFSRLSVLIFRFPWRYGPLSQRSFFNLPITLITNIDHPCSNSSPSILIPL